MTLTTVFGSLVMFCVWKRSLFIVLPFMLFFLTIELAYWSATLLKVPTGGWYPIMMAAMLAAVELLWHWGSGRRAAALARMAPQLQTLLMAHGGPDDALTSLTVRGPPIALLAPAGARRLTRTRGVAFYLTDAAAGSGEPDLRHSFTDVLRHFARGFHRSKPRRSGCRLPDPMLPALGFGPVEGASWVRWISGKGVRRPARGCRPPLRRGHHHRAKSTRGRRCPFVGGKEVVDRAAGGQIRV